MEIVYRSFELDPTSPKVPTESVADYLGRKYGGGAAAGAQARNVADHATLGEIAVGVGLDADRVQEVLASDEYADAVAADIAQARAYGATGVPFYVVDQKYGISGAQPTKVFSQVLERAWTQSHPTLQMTGDEGTECGPDGCPI